VAGGLLLSGLLNVLFGFSGLFGMALVLWALNGWAQSTGWGPLLKTLSAWFPPRMRGRVTAVFAPCYVVGHAASWALAGWLVGHSGWRSAFWVPGARRAGAAVAWAVLARDAPPATAAAPAAPRAVAPRRNGLAGLAELWRLPLLRWALVTCLLSGMIKDGLTLWGPTYLLERYGLSPATAALAGTVIPLAGAAGAAFAGWLVHRFHRESSAVLLLAPLMGLAAWGLAGAAGGGWLGLPLLGLIALGSHGINALLMSAVPLALGPSGRVSSAAGALDFASYVGGGLSALLVGGLQQLGGWPAVFAWWLATAAGLLIAAIIQARRSSMTASPVAEREPAE
jgi:OPA family glycerol-3-phosphate transporter-like MFS transporter